MADLNSRSSRTPVDAAALQAQLVSPDRLWTSLDVADSVESSNVTMAELAKKGAAGGAVLVAEEQTAGRGRRGRGWVAPQYSSVMVSVLVRPIAPPAGWGWVPLLTALAVADAVHDCGVSVTVKWPNDVLVGTRKIAGVLCEVVPTATGGAVVAGWGINVNQDVTELPSEGATSLLLEGGRLDRPALLVGALRAWESWYRRWEDGDNLVEPYSTYSSTLGSEVRVHLPDGSELWGRATAIDRRGGLVVLAHGQEHVVAAADVVHVRPGLA